jgi:uncharacterized protein (UPF0276 family)
VRSIDDVAPAGVGMVIFTPAVADVVDPALLDIVEIEPQLSWMGPGRAGRPVPANEAFLRHVAPPGVPTLLHSVGLPLGNAEAPPAHDLERLARDAELLDPLWVSEHLSFDRATVAGASVWTGFLLPPPQTRAAVRVASARLCALRDAVRRPVAFETGVNYFAGTDDELSDGAFFAAVAEEADCGILLDLHNLWANERNGRAPLERVVDALPLERVWELHLAGGQMHRGVYLDAHTGLVDQALMDIAARIVPRLPALRAIILEAIPDSLRTVTPDALREQLDALRALWALRVVRPRRSGRGRNRRAVHVRPPDARDVAAHADALGAAIAGAPAPVDGDRIALVGELVRYARGGALLRAAPLTTRLLLGELGADAFTALFERYAGTNAPEPFPAVEAQHFLSFVERETFAFPYLRAVVGVEHAIVTSVADGSSHAVLFPVEPAPVLRALQERRRPPHLAPSPHVVHVGPDGVRIRRARISPAAPRRAAGSATAVARRTSTAAAKRGNASART